MRDPRVKQHGREQRERQSFGCCQPSRTFSSVTGNEINGFDIGKSVRVAVMQFVPYGYHLNRLCGGQDVCLVDDDERRGRGVPDLPCIDPSECPPQSWVRPEHER